MFQFKFADIGEGIHEGTLLKWMVKEGDAVNEGDTLCLVETDKVNAELPSPVKGNIHKLLAKVGETIHVGDVIVQLEDGEPVKEGIEETPSGVVGELEVSSKVIASSREYEVQEAPQSRTLATPVARKLAKDLGIDIKEVKGSGPLGRVMKEDIYQERQPKVESQSVSNVTFNYTFKGEVERVKASKLRKTIAQNMVLSKSIIPHVTSMDEFDVTELVRLRQEYKTIAQNQSVHLTYMPFIIKALTLTMKDFPIFNSSYDHTQEEIIYKKYYHIGIAVDTEDGLIVPVIKNANELGIIPLSRALESIATQARSRTIPLDLLQDGTFTITNYGAFGSSYGVPVIRYPEVAILGLGKIAPKPVVIDEKIVIRQILPISLSYDHRVIDGADAGRFLTKLKAYLNEPALLLLS